MGKDTSCQLFLLLLYVGALLPYLLGLLLAFVILCYTGADIAVGAWLLSVANGTEDFFSPAALTTVAWMMVALGCLTFIFIILLSIILVLDVTLLNETLPPIFIKLILGTLAILLLLVLVNVILAFTAKGHVEASMRSGMNETIMVSYGYNNAATKTIDKLQLDYECCGANNYSDYSTSEFMKEQSKAVPDSCCVSNKNCTAGKPGMPENVTNLWIKGCVDASLPDMERYYRIAGGMCLGLLFVQILAFTIFVAVLYDIRDMVKRVTKQCVDSCCGCFKDCV